MNTSKRLPGTSFPPVHRLHDLVYAEFLPVDLLQQTLPGVILVIRYQYLHAILPCPNLLRSYALPLHFTCGAPKWQEEKSWKKGNFP